MSLVFKLVYNKTFVFLYLNECRIMIQNFNKVLNLDKEYFYRVKCYINFNDKLKLVNTFLLLKYYYILVHSRDVWAQPQSDRWSKLQVMHDF